MSNSLPPSDDDVEGPEPDESSDSVDAPRREEAGSDETGPADAQRTETPPEGPAGMLADIEEGFGHLIAAFERGVINIADAEGKKRRAQADASGDGAKAVAPSAKAASGSAKPGRAPRRGMTYEEALAPRRRRRKQSGAEDDATPVEDDSSSSADPQSIDPVLSQDAGGPETEELADPVTRNRQKGDAVFEPIDARPGMTYDEALQPIRWRNLAFGVIAALLLVALYWGVTFLQVWSSADDDTTQRADAVVVLGSAQFDGTPSPVLAARLDHALELWNDDLADFIVTTGSNQEGDRFTEGFSGFVYLREAGVPEDAILTIVDGEDTYQQLSASLVQMEERELETALLVSEGYHTHRLESIADELGLVAYVSPTSIEATTDDYIRETTAASIGRLVGYRRLSAWTDSDPE